MLLCSCKEDVFKYEIRENTGFLTFDGFSVSVDDEVNTVTKDVTEASGDYSITLNDSDGTLVWTRTYS